MQLRIAALEQQIESQKESSEKAKEATVSAADLAAERAAKAVLGKAPIRSEPSFKASWMRSRPTTCFEKQM